MQGEPILFFVILACTRYLKKKIFYEARKSNSFLEKRGIKFPARKAKSNHYEDIQKNDRKTPSCDNIGGMMFGYHGKGSIAFSNIVHTDSEVSFCIIKDANPLAKMI
jgi:hypothetical protein